MRLIAVSLIATTACSSTSEDDRTDRLNPPSTHCASQLFDETQTGPIAASTYSYDEDGWSRIERFDRGLDGTVDFQTRARYQGDRWSMYQELIPDENGVMVISFEETWTWEGDQVVLHTVDEDGVGGGDYAWTYVYVDGRWIEARYDRDADGTIDAVEMQNYDERGLRVSTDLLIAGRTYERTNVFTYDAEDRLIGLDTDRDGDGQFDRHSDFEHDDFGYRSYSLLTYLDDSGYQYEQRWQNGLDRRLRWDLTDLTDGVADDHRWVVYAHDCE